MPGFFAHAPLRHFQGDFWKFWSGQTISTLGSSVTSFALPLLVFKLTNSPLNLALTMVFTVLPYLLFGLAIGAWVDRTNRRRVMVDTDCARALVIASIPLLTVLGLSSVWWIYMVSFANATLTIGFTAANFAALPSLVEPDDLIAANGSIQASFSIASIIGPLVAGLLLVRVPLPLLLLIDAASFLVSAASLLLIKRSFNASEQKGEAGIGNAILEGLHYVLLGRVITFLRVLTWPTGALGVLLGGLAIAQAGNVGLVYGCVGLLVFLVAFAFWLTPLGHAERYVPEVKASQGD